jgi:myo-inositol-1(or 4)-monophosphatase
MTSGLFADKLSNVVEDVGAFCLDGFHRLSTVVTETKAPADYVSEIDRGAEALAIKALGKHFPDIPMVGEEGGGQAVDRYWIVDPVDGTANFLSGLPIWAVSIALVERGRPTLGAISIPALGITVVGGDGVPLRVAGTTTVIEGARIAFGVGRNPKWSREERQALEAQIEARGQHVVCLGSCAASLAFVALGRLAGYIERGVALWDCAAGYALLTAVGREVSITPSLIDGRVDVCAERAAAGPLSSQPNPSAQACRI